MFLKCGILRNLFCISQRKVGFLLRYYDINTTIQILRYKANDEKKTRLFHGLIKVSLFQIDPRDVTRTSVRVFVTAVRSPSQLYTELCALVNKPSGASAGASDLK